MGFIELSEQRQDGIFVPSTVCTIDAFKEANNQGQLEDEFFVLLDGLEVSQQIRIMGGTAGNTMIRRIM